MSPKATPRRAPSACASQNRNDMRKPIEVS
jgi:hypothetical protein